MIEQFYQYSFFFLYFAIALVVITLLLLIIKLLMLLKKVKKMQPGILKLKDNVEISNVKVNSIIEKISHDLATLKQILTYTTIAKMAYELFIDDDDRSVKVAAKSVKTAIKQSREK